MNRRLPPAVEQERVTVRVKWFNPTKGFGFVVPEDDETKDAFLHASVLPQPEAQSIGEGATLVCDLAQGQKGMMVATVYSVDLSTVVQSFGGGGGAPGGGGPRGGFGDDRGPRRPPTSPGDSGEGTVKFFNEAKGFGFVTPDNGGNDIFVSARILGRAGIATLETDQRVRFESRIGDKGPMADKIELI